MHNFNSRVSTYGRFGTGQTSFASLAIRHFPSVDARSRLRFARNDSRIGGECGSIKKRENHTLCTIHNVILVAILALGNEIAPRLFTSKSNNMHSALQT